MTATEQQLWGTWWREGAPANKVDGTLHLADDEFPRLELNRVLLGVGEDSCTIHGDVGGRVVTLFDTAATYEERHSLDSEGFHMARSTLRVLGGALVPDAAGRHLSGRDEAAFDSALVGIDHLSFWDGRTHVHSDPPSDQSDQSAQTFKFDVVVDPERVGVFNDVTVATRTRWRVPALGDYRRDEVRIAATFSTVFAVEGNDPLSIRRLSEISRSLSSLVTVGMNRDSRVRGRLRLRVQADWYELWSRPELMNVPDAGEMTDDAQRDVLFLLSDVKDFGQMLANWSTLTTQAKYGADSVVALWRESATFYENKLMATCNAIEALDRGLHRDHGSGDRRPSYRARCAKLIAIPDPEAVRILVGDPAKWAGDVTRARNDLAHGYATDERKTPPDVWRALTDRCRAVLALVLMAKLGLSPEVQKRAVKVGGLHRYRAEDPH